MAEIKYAVVKFFLAPLGYVGIYIIPKTFEDIKEAEEFRIKYLESSLETDPQNLQVVSYKL